MRKAIIILALASLVLAACSQPSAPTATAVGDGSELVMYKSPQCGCCSGHAAALKQAGYDVRVVKSTDLQGLKRSHGVPSDKQSCHTIVVGDYFIEGHVPIEVVNKFLEEKPDVDGIALPGMPLGTPGMPGPKAGDYVIYGIKDGEATEYMRV